MISEYLPAHIIFLVWFEFPSLTQNQNKDSSSGSPLGSDPSKTDREVGTWDRKERKPINLVPASQLFTAVDNWSSVLLGERSRVIPFEGHGIYGLCPLTPLLS